MCEATEQNACKVLEKLGEEHPDAHLFLDYDGPLDLLIRTILAAQCTDERVNEVAPELWAEYPTAADIAEADAEDVQQIVHSTGFFRRKTKSIQNACRAIAEEYDGEVPDTLEELTAIPGVGRKTANVVLANSFGRDALPVDTHVKRVSRRIGLAQKKSADAIERELCEIIPRERWSRAALLMGTHGRRICTSRSPACEDCPVSGMCDYCTENS
jgi:endonuclease-3